MGLMSWCHMWSDRSCPRGLCPSFPLWNLAGSHLTDAWIPQMGCNSTFLEDSVNLCEVQETLARLLRGYLLTRSVRVEALTHHLQLRCQIVVDLSLPRRKVYEFPCKKHCHEFWVWNGFSVIVHTWTYWHKIMIQERDVWYVGTFHVL